MIVATRNHLIHDYLTIDHDTPWGIVAGEIPELFERLEALKNNVRDGDQINFP